MSAGEGGNRLIKREIRGPPGDNGNSGGIEGLGCSDYSKSYLKSQNNPLAPTISPQNALAFTVRDLAWL